MRIHVAFPHTFSVPRFPAVSVSRDVPFALSPFLPFLSMQCAVAFSFPGQVKMRSTLSYNNGIETSSPDTKISVHNL